MNLTRVLAFLGLEDRINSCELQDIQIDSRQIKPGDLFVAVPGLSTDGRDHIEQAIANGAAAILVEAPYTANVSKRTYLTTIKNLKEKLPILAAFFYRHPSSELKIIGVTGTNGKTSTTHYTAQILEANNLHCGIMGTLGNGLLSDLNATQLTTSDCCTIQRQLATLKQLSAKFVAMEVSSHALTQDRLVGTSFDTAVFTNLSQDHLDYHQNMQDYFMAKTRLFTEFSPKNCVINLDDANGVKLMAMIVNQDTRILGYSISNPLADIYLDGDQLHTLWGSGELRSPLIGKFNLSNILACIACCGIYGVDLEKILFAIQEIKPVPGRMQKVLPHNSNLPTVIVDYAHSPDAVIKALQTLSEYKHDKLYCILGCGGDRDRTKRPLMLKAAIEYSDRVVITMDNPRTEDPQQIVDDMLRGVDVPLPRPVIELDRAKAINDIISKAGPNDIILIAGKGHEDYQIIGTKKQPFSDVLVAQKALEFRSEHSWAT